MKIIVLILIISVLCATSKKIDSSAYNKIKKTNTLS